MVGPGEGVLCDWTVAEVRSRPRTATTGMEAADRNRGQQDENPSWRKSAFQATLRQQAAPLGRGLDG
jgi:hypothetical protein